MRKIQDFVLKSKEMFIGLEESGDLVHRSMPHSHLLDIFSHVSMCGARVRQSRDIAIFLVRLCGVRLSRSELSAFHRPAFGAKNADNSDTDSNKQLLYA